MSWTSENDNSPNKQIKWIKRFDILPQAFITKKKKNQKKNTEMVT